MPGGIIRKLWGKAWPALIAAAAFVLILLAFSTGWWPAQTFRGIQEVIARSVTGIAGFLAFAALICLLNRRNTDAEKESRLPRTGTDGIDLVWLFERQRAALATENLESVPAFIQLLVDPGSYRMRTEEAISLRGRVIEQHVSVLFGSLPNGNHGETHIPILTPHKGELIDNLKLLDGDGAALSVLCHDETMELVQLSLHFLIMACLAERNAQQRAVWTDDASRAEALFLEIIFGETPDPRTFTNEINTAFEWLAIPSGTHGQPSVNATWLREFVTLLSTAYPIVAVAPPAMKSDRLLVTYSRTIVPSATVSGVKDRVRLALGLRPLKVNVSPLLAYTSKSYHLWIAAPDTQYILEQVLRCRSCRETLKCAGHVGPDGWRSRCHHEPESEAFCRLQERHGQNYVHLYMRGFQDSERTNLELTSSFGEAPPGTLASAAMTAGMAVLFIGVAGHTAVTRGTANSDVPALVLALPAAAASWFGFVSDSEAVLRSSLTGRCSLIAGGLVSLAAAGVYVLGTKGTRGPHGIQILGMPLPSWWSVLFLLAAANAVYVVIQLALRSRIYRSLLLHEEPDAEHTVG